MRYTSQACRYNMPVISVFAQKMIGITLAYVSTITRLRALPVLDEPYAYIQRKLHFLCIKIYFVVVLHKINADNIIPCRRIDSISIAASISTLEGLLSLFFSQFASFAIYYQPSLPTSPNLVINNEIDYY